MYILLTVKQNVKPELQSKKKKDNSKKKHTLIKKYFTLGAYWNIFLYGQMAK